MLTSNKSSSISAVNIVSTIAPVDIVTRRLIEKVKSLFQPVATTFLPSYRVPDSLLSVFLPRKQSPVTTDYIIPRVYIVDPEFRVFMFGGEDRYKRLAWKCVYIY